MVRIRDSIGGYQKISKETGGWPSPGASSLQLWRYNVQVFLQFCFHFFLLLSSVSGLVFGTARVTSLSVNRIGLGGGMITINGEGFATDAFSQFDPSKGNKVRGCFLFQIYQ